MYAILINKRVKKTNALQKTFLIHNNVCFTINVRNTKNFSVTTNVLHT